MKYYNTNGKLVDFELGLPINNGQCSNIYKLDEDYAFKEYFKYTSYRARMSYEIYKILKDLNYSHTNKVIELYYEYDKIDNKNDLVNNLNNYMIDGYKYLYINEDNINILEMPSEYLLYNLSALENFIDSLIEQDVYALDLKRANTVYTSDKIILIDLDCLRKGPFANFNNIKEYNKKELTNLFINLFKNCSSYLYQYEHEIISLFSVNISEKSVTSSVSKKLINCKRPIDYIKRY